MKKFRMTKIKVPAWAARPEVWLDSLRLSEYEAVRQHRERMFAIVHREVERYLNTPALYGDGDPDMFPDRGRMTGEYYLGDESYRGNLGHGRTEFSIMCRCLKRPSGQKQQTSDYLGLEVWLRWSPAKPTSFTVYRNTDSSSI